MMKYYSMTRAKNSATISIYGDITSYPWNEGDTSSANLSRQLEALDGVEEISVYINSYGGEVAEGLAIYNALKRHKAKVKTYCDGFAASIASVIFMAGDERVMNDSSLLMIHNAWTMAMGNAKELRKQADDLEKITQASITAYKAHSSLTEEEITELMDNETWILPEEAMEYGFATAIEKTVSANASQSARHSLFKLIKAAQEAAENDEEEEEGEEDTETPADEENAAETADEAENDSPEDESEDEESEDEENEEKPEEGNKAAQKMERFFTAFLHI